MYKTSLLPYKLKKNNCQVIPRKNRGTIFTEKTRLDEIEDETRIDMVKKGLRDKERRMEMERLEMVGFIYKLIIWILLLILL